ncbi:MAG: DnaJ domain-containing protein [Labilithrix sp.]|nr:DnaJ domain-containing protein [Labilithrix sp.]MCW5814703.1 DnaJ domain-containing protein [Labilithrix sp.]
MQLPGRLKATTLGDLLGALHRGRASGTLELVETGGRAHRVHLAKGLVTAVEVDRAAASLGEILRHEEDVDDDVLRRSLLRAMASQRLHGEVLVRDFQIAPQVVERALRKQILMRLQMLEGLVDAQVFYRVAVRPPRGALVDEPLGADEFLAGRKRARDRAVEPASGVYRTARPASGMPGSVDVRRVVAYRTLGLSSAAGEPEVKQAYRRLVREYHPDLHPEASHEERRALSARFAEVTAAYRALVA